MVCFNTNDDSLSRSTMVPDMNKRTLMNAILLLGGAGPVVAGLGVPFVLFFIPKASGGGGGSITALDRNGDAVTVEGWLKDHGANSKALTSKSGQVMDAQKVRLL